MDKRLHELEVRIAYQDQAIAALDEVIQEFTKRVATLERELKQFRETAMSEHQIGPADDPPPHY